MIDKTAQDLRMDELHKGLIKARDQGTVQPHVGGKQIEGLDYEDRKPVDPPTWWAQQWSLLSVAWIRFWTFK